MKREKLVLELNKTAAVFRSPLSTLAIDGYAEAFEDVSDDDFVRACRRAREECDFMPTIKQLRQFVPNRRARAEAAATDRWLADNAAHRRKKPWPLIGRAEPTPVAELVAQMIGPSTEEH